MYLVVSVVALVASGLTFFSGFGLGTLLMPAFAVFFPIEVAIAATAVVHLANNVFAAGLVGKRADWGVVVRFGLPAALAALAGAWLLKGLADSVTIATYTLGSRACTITWAKVVVAVVIAAFALLELWPRFDSLSFSPGLVPVGGAVSGFFGGLSGHQGALRSAFLLRLGMPKEQFVATGKMTAILIDVSRLAIYGVTFGGAQWADLRAHGGVGVVIAAVLAAFAGSFAGAKLLRKVELAGLRRFVGAMLVLMAVALGAGVV